MVHHLAVFDVKDGVRKQFGEFYAALFDRTMQVNPGAVVTEYAWAATPGGMCDPCPPESTLVTNADLQLLGGDVVGGNIAAGTFVLTRLHARYGKSDMKDDLRFAAAEPIVGGREIRNDKGALEYGFAKDSVNNFQARYAIRHPWTGPIACAQPRRGVWGGPWNYREQTEEMIMARKVAFAPRGKLSLRMVVKRRLPEINVRPYVKPKNPPPQPDSKTPVLERAK